MWIGSPSLKTGRSGRTALLKISLRNSLALGSDLPVITCSEERESHGSNNPSLLPRRFPSSPMGCPMQIFWTPDHHGNPYSNKNSLVHLRFSSSCLSLLPCSASLQTVFPGAQIMGRLPYHPLSVSVSFYAGNPPSLIFMASVQSGRASSGRTDLLAIGADARLCCVFYSRNPPS